MISITNTSYPLLAVGNRPFIGWQSIVSPDEFSMTGVAQGGYGVTNLWSPDTYTQWRTALFTSGQVNDVIMSTDGETSVSYIAIVGHNAGNFADNTVSIQTSPDASTWTTIDSITAEDNSPIIFYFDSTIANFFRVLFEQTGASPNDYFQAAHIRMGVGTILERPMFVGTKPTDRRVQKVTNTSDNGRNLGDTLVSVTRPYSINQQNNSGAFARLFVDDFLDHCELLLDDQAGPMGAFFYAWRPEEYPQDTYYCHAPQSVSRPEYQRPNSMMEWSISGVAER